MALIKLFERTGKLIHWTDANSFGQPIHLNSTLLTLCFLGDNATGCGAQAVCQPMIHVACFVLSVSTIDSNSLIL